MTTRLPTSHTCSKCTTVNWRELGASGRIDWVSDACNEMLLKPITGKNPEDAWMRLKDTRTLRPRARAVAQSVAAWRERRAMEKNIPVRQVLPDLAVLGISQRAPTTERELSQGRGVDDRFSRGAIAEEILAAVEAGSNAEPPEVSRGTDDLERELRPAVTLVSAWVSQLARTEKIDTSMLATRADLVALLSNDPDARLAHGWRAGPARRPVSVVWWRARRRSRSTEDSGLRLVDVARTSTGLSGPLRLSRRVCRRRRQRRSNTSIGSRGAAAVRVDRATFADRLVEHDALRHRRLPDRVAADDQRQFGDTAIGFATRWPERG